MNRTFVRTTAIVLLALSAAACATTTPVAVKAGGANPSAVAAKKTFSFGTLEASMNGFEKGEATPEVIEKVKAEVVAGLKAKGFEEAASGTEGELTVYVAAGTRKVFDDRSVAAMRLGAGQTTGTERGIALDIMEKGSTTPIFHADARYDADMKVVDADKVHAAVTELVAKVPASAK